MVNIVHSFLVSENGATAVEYAMIVAMISVVAIVSIESIGFKVNGNFGEIDQKLK